MIDLLKIKYSLVLMTEAGEQLKIDDYIENLGWEENENELAARISFTAKNHKTAKGILGEAAKIGCMVGVLVQAGNSASVEVARGYLVSWNPKESLSGSTLACTCYDELYNFQQSQDNVYYSPGAGTKTVLTELFDRWQIPVETYEGPDVTHAKLVYKSESLSDIIKDLLDDAQKKGAPKCIVRASRGMVSILPYGSNKTVYCFEADNIKSVNHSLSSQGMVTRVKIIGQADDEGLSPVEATLDGQIKFGVRQKIHIREKDSSLEDARSAAQEILNEKGDLQEKITVGAPDVPFIRKGDVIYLRAAGLKAHYYVTGIRHDASSCSMSMDLKKAENKTVSENKTETVKSYKPGDVVNFHGGTHYISSYPDSKGYSARPGKARITIANGSGKAHPWHLIHCDSSSNVYGWVDEGTFD